MDELQSYLFREGNCAYAYQFMGAHPVRGGYAFTVWAPNATAVSVVGDFNGWDHTKNPMENDNGIWSTRIAGIKQYATYKIRHLRPQRLDAQGRPLCVPCGDAAQDREQNL